MTQPRLPEQDVWVVFLDDHDGSDPVCWYLTEIEARDAMRTLNAGLERPWHSYARVRRGGSPWDELQIQKLRRRR